MTHPVQTEMVRLEQDFGAEGRPSSVDFDASIAELSGFAGDIDNELDPLLTAEWQRAMDLYNDYYALQVGRPRITDPVAVTLVAVGFLQGVTFARAVANLNAEATDE